MACLAGTLLNRMLQDILILVRLPRILTKSAQPHDYRKHWVSLRRCSSHQCQPVPTFRPGHLPPWAPWLPQWWMLCLWLTAWGSALTKWQYRKDVCLGGLFRVGVLESNKVRTLTASCWLPQKTGRSPPGTVLCLRAPNRHRFNLLPHFRCYHSRFHFCFWNIPGTTESYPSNWCQIYIQSCPPHYGVQWTF